MEEGSWWERLKELRNGTGQDSTPCSGLGASAAERWATTIGKSRYTIWYKPESGWVTTQPSDSARGIIKVTLYSARQTSVCLRGISAHRWR